MSELDSMAEEVAAEQKAIERQGNDTRKRVIRMGKLLLRMQKRQKKEQATAKERGEEPVPWKDWCDQKSAVDGAFPAARSVNKLCAIAKYPGAYRSGMSIDQAAKAATAWKKNGGNPPPKQKVSIKSRRLITLGAQCGKLIKRMKGLAEGWDKLQGSEKWTSEEKDGARHALTMLSKECRILLANLKRESAST